MNSVTNIVEKGEIAHYEQILLLLECYQQTFDSEAKSAFVWERVKLELEEKREMLNHLTLCFVCKQIYQLLMLQKL